MSDVRVHRFGQRRVGIRIFARYAFEAGYVTGPDFILATRGGVVAVRQLNAQASLIEVDMGRPSFRSADIQACKHRRP